MPESQMLPVMEMFHTIQGEGFHQGKAAFFIRLAGCDVGCTWCDVKDSWDASQHPVISIEEIVKQASSGSSQIAVITGGEPLIYNLEGLTNSLRQAGFLVHIETAGVYPISGTFDWITFSPKKFKAPLSEYFENADELKTIVAAKNDLEWSEKMAQKMEKNGHKLFLQPEWSRSEKVVPMITDYVKANPKWQVSLQIHKFMNIP